MKPCDRMRAFRDKYTLETQDLADALGVHERTVRKWESEERAIPWPVVVFFDCIEAVPAARKWFLNRIINTPR